jgi:hypothetical protein
MLSTKLVSQVSVFLQDSGSQLIRSHQLALVMTSSVRKASVDFRLFAAIITIENHTDEENQVGSSQAARLHIQVVGLTESRQQELPEAVSHSLLLLLLLLVLWCSVQWRPSSRRSWVTCCSSPGLSRWEHPGCPLLSCSARWVLPGLHITLLKACLCVMSSQ